jgi:putative ABC transport system permease protein
MLSLYRTLSLRYLGQRRLRAALIVVSIALGVAALVGTRILNQSMTKAAENAINPLSGTADLIIGNMDTGVPAELMDEIKNAAIPGIVDVNAFVEGRAALPDRNNKLVRFIGLPLSVAQRQDNRWGIEVQARPLNLLMMSGKPAILGASVARELDGGAGSSVFRLRARGKEHRLATMATFTVLPDSPMASIGDNLIVLDVTTAAAIEFPHRPGLVSRIDVVLDSSADRAHVQSQVQDLIGQRGDVRTPKAADDSLRDVTAGLELGLDLGSAGALVVGLFLVYMALAVSVAERRHDIGILRSVGATRGQVAALFAGEACLLGLVGSMCGLPMGIGLAHGALGPMNDLLSDIFVPVNARVVHVRADTLAMAVAAGMFTALLAALVPAFRAAFEEPADAVRRVPSQRRLVHYLLLAAISLFFIVAGLSLIAFKAHLAPRHGTFFGVVLMFIGGLAASPILAAILLASLVNQVLFRLLRPILRIEDRLAADHMFRSPTRSGLVIGALAAGLGLLIQTAGTTQSSEAGLLRWVDQHVAADLFVTSHSPITAGGQALPMTRDLVEEIAADADVRAVVDAVVPIRLHPIDNFRGHTIVVTAFDAQAAHDAILRRVPVSDQRLYARLHAEPGSALVSENFAELYGVKIGDIVQVRAKDGPVDVRVIGTLLDYTWNRGTILVDWPWFQEQFDDPAVDLIHIFVRSGVPLEDARHVLTSKWGVRESLHVLTRAELRNGIKELLQRIYIFGYAEESVVGVVAMLGVLTALLISVLQRRREIGLLRAIGASRAQIVRSVLAEALLMGLIGSLIGIAAGVFLEWYSLRVIMLDDAGFTFEVLFPWQATAVFVGFTWVVSTLAGLFPAWQAMRLRIPEAIAYE